ncbi:hypothetical protein POM88_002163 [Heracleum sosnowskyi]|uniref:Uncharacterized protein n=1 Tax=Heracleum sosnowskyi TaxID=360622 RepID=A0AAD8NCB5_9APIA|nr:hypothetical protein POM88_002163 [Heracleum sosnowskyi]
MGSWSLLMGHFGIAIYAVTGLLNPLHPVAFVQLQRSAETFLLDVRKMEPIDGLNRITKCSNNSCHVAYHPLCARAVGFYLEFEDGDTLRLNSEKEGKENLCIRLISYCKRHRRPSDWRIVVQNKIGQSAHQQSDYILSPNPSGCAKTNHF